MTCHVKKDDFQPEFPAICFPSQPYFFPSALTLAFNKCPFHRYSTRRRTLTLQASIVPSYPQIIHPLSSPPTTQRIMTIPLPDPTGLARRSHQFHTRLLKDATEMAPRSSSHAPLLSASLLGQSRGIGTQHCLYAYATAGCQHFAIGWSRQIPLFANGCQ